MQSLGLIPTMDDHLHIASEIEKSEKKNFK